MCSVGPADHYNYVTGKCLSTLVHVATVASGRLIIMWLTVNLIIVIIIIIVIIF